MKVAVTLYRYLWRPLSESDEDTDFVLEMRNATAAQQVFFTPRISREEHLRFLKAPEREQEINWIIETHEGERVGASGIYHIDQANRRAESGRVVMKHPELYVLNLFVSSYVVFEHLGLNKLVGDALASNAAVTSALARAGGTREGLLREHVFRNGAPQDVHLYGLLAKTWRETKASAIEQLGEPRMVQHFQEEPT